MLRVTTEWGGVGQGQPWYSTHYFEGVTSAAAQSATAALATFWGAVDAIQSNLVTWHVQADVEVVDEVTGNITGLASGTATTAAGALATAPLPWASQGLIRWRTGIFRDGRELRGRTFIPALTTASASSGSVIGGTVTTLDAAAEALIADINCVLVAWQRPRPANPETGVAARAGSTAIVSSASVWTEFAQLRSRRD